MGFGRFGTKMDVCFGFRRMGMGELIYPPGIDVSGPSDIYFGKRDNIFIKLFDE